MKLIYSPNLNHAYIVTEKQLAKLIYNCVGIYCCVVTRLFKYTSRSGAHCTIVFQRRLIIETTFLVQQSTFIACTFILFWQFVLVCQCTLGYLSKHSLLILGECLFVFVDIFIQFPYYNSTNLSPTQCQIDPNFLMSKPC